MSNEGWTNNDASPNWDEAPTEIPPIAAGIYAVTIGKFEPAKSKEGQPQLKVTVTCDASYPSGTAAKGQATKTLTFDYTKDGNVVAIAQVIKATGVRGPRNNSFDEVREFGQALLGSKCYARFQEPRTWQGRLMSNLDRLMNEEDAGKALSGEGSGDGEAAGGSSGRPKRR